MKPHLEITEENMAALQAFANHAQCADCHGEPDANSANSLLRGRGAERLLRV